MIWIAFFTKTGSEIVEVANRLKKWPDYIITNRDPNGVGLHKELANRQIHYIPNNPTVVDYIRLLVQKLDIMYQSDAHTLNLYWTKNTIVTLHGYMRILPEVICEAGSIYNGHPGLITKYPALKGKDPQKRAFENEGYKTAGCVIHEVTSTVDGGEVVAEKEFVISPCCLEDFISILHAVSVNLWIDFLSEKFKINYHKEYYVPLDQLFPVPETGKSSEAIEWCQKNYPQTLAELKYLQQVELELFCQKQMDYGHTNISIGQDITNPDGKRVALSSLIFRCNDKIQRLINMVVKQNKTVAANEPVMDAFSDLALYGKIAKIVDKGIWGK